MLRAVRERTARTIIRDLELPVPFELGQFIAGLKYEWSQQVRTNGPVQRRPQKGQISPRYNSTLGDDRRSDRPRSPCIHGNRRSARRDRGPECGYLRTRGDLGP